MEMTDKEIKEKVSEALDDYEAYFLSKSALHEGLLDYFKQNYNVEEVYLKNNDEIEGDENENELIEGLHDDDVKLDWFERWHWKITNKN